MLREAVAYADESGGVPSMRKIAERLGVEAMSLYHHFRNKDLILDGMVDHVFAEIEPPPPATEWRAALGHHAASMRDVLVRHPWAIGLMDSRGRPGPATLRRHDGVLGLLRANGFPVAGAAHAVSALDSYVYGFVLQELSLPFATAGELDEVASGILDAVGEEYPHLAELIAHRNAHSPAVEFGAGLDLVLDGLERWRA
ncbi:hypothetical protein Afil01_67200 [Actinorhabdospora filicis]|uniref:HTH tetR-type domain-containing protein n=1 Tax=Actinorhabdospora filicis TaxID=1785913 RepID=A0A9W6STR6_9ACTN|nr:hypothetical protein Afil01_67200 [Actinorhabdospora filicis]